MKGLLFLLIGPAGVGKNTLMDILVKRTGLSFVPSFSSRPMREGESLGNPYYFISREEFERKIEGNDLIEWKCVHGRNYYGIGKSAVEEKIDGGENIITDIEVLGAIDVIDFLPSFVVSIFVNINSRDELVNRMRNRGLLSSLELERRIARLDLELDYKDHFDYYIENDDLARSVSELERIIDFETDLSVYRSRSVSILHYCVRIIITNSRGEVLLLRHSAPVLEGSWYFIKTHVLKHETPNDAVYRGLHYIYPCVPYESKKLIYSLRNILEETYSLSNHYHYEMTFHISLDNDNMYSDNYDFRWFSLDAASSYLDSGDIFLVKSQLGVFPYMS